MKFSLEENRVVIQCLKAMQNRFDSADDDEDETEEAMATLADALEAVRAGDDVDHIEHLHGIALSLHLLHEPTGIIFDAINPKDVDIANELIEKVTEELITLGGI